MRRVWLVLGCLVVPTVALALAWDATFEAAPPFNAPLSEGDDRIRELKEEIRERGETEVCWGTQDPDGCGVVDNGRLRAGSARIFTGTAPPVTLNALDRLGINLLDAGRCFLDEDGPDNVGGNRDDNALYCLDTSLAWRLIAYGASATKFLTAGAAVGDYLRFDGTDWLDQTPPNTLVDAANWADEAVGVEPGLAQIDTENGSGLDGRPKVTIPATGDYYIELMADGDICFDGVSDLAAAVELVEVDDVTGATTVVLRTVKLGNGNATDNVQQSWSLHYIQPHADVANSTTYTYDIQAEASAAGVSISDSNCATGTGAAGSGAPVGRLSVIAHPVKGLR